MELTRVNGGRYLPLGDAGFLALTDGLRRRLDELASASTEQADGRLRISALAAGSLAETFEDTAFEGSPEWHARLARLQHQWGRTQKARELLTPVYDRFTEGFETSDLMAAKGLLDQLA